MIYYKTAEEIELIRQSCMLVSETLAYVGSLLKPGVKGKDVDSAAETFIRDHKAIPGFKNYNGFPATLCISINECVVHGIPSDREFQDGDIASVDCGVFMNGFFGDAAYTFAIGAVAPETMDLLEVTNTALYKGIEQARIGNRLGDIGFAIQDFTQREHGYGVVRELVGHGIGKKLHEAPEVPNFGKRGKGIKLLEGLVLAIEPMINLGGKAVETSRDGWTVISKDRSPSAHYEHSVAITTEGPKILSDHSIVEESISKNPNLKKVGVLDMAKAS